LITAAGMLAECLSTRSAHVILLNVGPHLQNISGNMHSVV
jgi:hypothetical protein